MDYTKLWQHYNDIKVKYNLTYTDILRQMNVYPSCAYINYLSNNRQTPSNRTGSIGKGFRDLLEKHINKTDWLPSNMSYADYLNERMSGNSRISARMVETCSNCDECPLIDVDINISEVPDNYTEEQLEGMFTFNGIVPKINHVSKSMYL